MDEWRRVVVEAFDAGKDVLLGLISGFKLPVMDEFGFQRMEEAFHRALSWQSALRLIEAWKTAVCKS